MKSRIEEIEELIAEDDICHKNLYKQVLWQFKSAAFANDFDKWLNRRISLEIEKHELLKNGKNEKVKK